MLIGKAGVSMVLSEKVRQSELKVDPLKFPVFWIPSHSQASSLPPQDMIKHSTRIDLKGKLKEYYDKLKVRCFVSGQFVCQHLHTHFQEGKS